MRDDSNAHKSTIALVIRGNQDVLSVSPIRSGVIEGHAGMLAGDKFCRLLSTTVIGPSQFDASHWPSFINQVELTGRSDEMQSRLTE